MTRNIYILFSVALLLCLHAGKTYAWEGIVVKVIDGDSLKIQRNGELLEVRLYGIDTPEYKQAFSNKAKQFTKRLAYRKVVSVVEKDIDRYGRIVGLVTSQGKLVNRELVRNGFAWYYPRYCRSQPVCGELQLMERKARKERRGLWKDENPVAPWDWKRQKRTGGSKSRAKWYYWLLDWL